MSFTFIIKRVLLPFLGLLGLFTVIVLVINLSVFDEDLSPEIVELMKPSQMPNEKDNAYFAVWGLSAASDKDMLKSGIKLIQQYQQRFAEKIIDNIPDELFTQYLGEKGLNKQWSENFKPCNARKKQGCLSDFVEQLKSLPLDGERLQLSLKRFQQILDMQQYKSIDQITFATELPPYGDLMKLSHLTLASSSIVSPESFTQQLQKDLRFWRMLLAEDTVLIGKMVAVAGIWTDLQFISEYVKNTNLTIKQTDSINNLLYSLTLNEKDISEAILLEQRAMYYFVNNIDPELFTSIYELNIPFMKWFLQPNATMNSYYQLFTSPYVELSKQSTQDFFKIMNNCKITSNNKSCVLTKYNLLTPSSLYNLSGKLMITAGFWAAESYIARVHDLNGMISLVKLQLSLKNTAQDALSSAVKNSNIRNQYSNQAFEFDAENSLLSFECLDKGSQCRIQL